MASCNMVAAGLGVEAVRLARRCIGVPYAFYNEDCDLASGADGCPGRLNCKLLVWWVLRELDIAVGQELPEQLEAGMLVDDLQGCCDGDLLFTSGLCFNHQINYEGRMLEIGHVGFWTRDLTIIHASYCFGAVVEESVASFLKRRYRIAQFRRVLLCH